MSDPTFSTQFGIAVQADMLRQAATERQRRQARSLRRDDSPGQTRLLTSARRLARMGQLRVRWSRAAKAT